MQINLSQFRRVEAFYAFPALVSSPFITVRYHNELYGSEQDLVDFIDDVRMQLDDLYFCKVEDGVLLCTTALDNETVIALSNNHGITLYFGKYNDIYQIGFGVIELAGNNRYKIDLSGKNVMLHKNY